MKDAAYLVVLSTSPARPPGGEAFIELGKVSWTPDGLRVESIDRMVANPADAAGLQRMLDHMRR